MTSIFETKGAPRDLGVAQGRACRAAIERNLASYCQATRSERSVVKILFGIASHTKSVERDLSRFFPHHAERLVGLASGAQVATADLIAVLAGELGNTLQGVAPSTLGLHFGVIETQTANATDPAPPHPLLFKTVEAGLRCPRQPIVRRTSPDNGYASIELTFPEQVLSLAGVNECGLALVVSVPSATRVVEESITVPASLLGQDCLLRFDAAEKAIDWCRTRPVGGVADLLFADAAGNLMGIEIRGKDRKITLPLGGALMGMAEDARSLALQAQIQHLNELSAETVFELLRIHAVTGALAPCRHDAWIKTAAAVIVDPVARSLRWTEQAPCGSHFENLFCATV